MAYFNQFTEFLYKSPLKSRSSSFDTIRVKNIFRRAKVRDDIFGSAVAFNKYQVLDGERPDQVANKVYGSSEYDWVVLLSNNILNIREEWPLSNYEFNKYIENKYTQAEYSQIHHYETTEVVDSKGKMILPAGRYVDADFTITYFDGDISETRVIDETITFDSSSVTFDSSLIRLNDEGTTVTNTGLPVTVSPVKAIDNYQYEVKENEKKRNIYVLEPRFLQTIIDDFEAIMKVKLSSQYLDRTTKKGDDLKTTSLD